MKILSSIITSAALLICVAVEAAESPFILLQSTTSTRNSGLYDYLLPLYEAQSGTEIRVVALGTGQALKNARNGDADVLIVHAKNAEEQFVADGFGIERFDLMYNDFVVVGPASDPAQVGDSSDILNALKAIAGHGANGTSVRFASRGDDSGTHKKERALWRGTDIDVATASGSWYRETGSGMGATLNVAVGMNAYTLTDRATWLAFANKSDFVILLEGDERLFNQYGAIVVNPKVHPHVKATAAQAFVDWLLDDRGQAAIGAFEVDGQQLFYPNAAR